MKKILVTGATGPFGAGAIDFLLNKGIEAKCITAMVRNEKNSSGLRASGINVVMGDYDDYTSLLSAFKGTDIMLFVSSSDVPNRTAQHRNVVDAAKESGVGYMIYTSGLNRVRLEESAIGFVAEAHVKTEEWIKQSGIPYTLLQNSLYLDIIPQFIGEALKNGVVYLPAENGKTAFTLRAEMAEAAANIIVGGGHEGKTYQITNPESYTYQEVADALSDIAGQKINYVSPNIDEFTTALKNGGLTEDIIGGFTAFATAQARGEFNITGNDLQELLGRKPTTLREYLYSVYGTNE